MRLVLISDTHRRHKDLVLPEGDVLVHAGDLTERGTLHEVADALAWFSQQPHPHKVCIAGNHDFYFEEQPRLARRLVPRGVTYLQDSGVTIEGVRFWGSPVTPWFMDWAFNRHPAGIGAYWSRIPGGTDVLITHGPPRGVLDKLDHADGHVGCPQLLERVQKIQPKVHVFGHIHEGYGQVEVGGTRFVNASTCDVRYQPKNAPVVVDL